MGDKVLNEYRVKIYNENGKKVIDKTINEFEENPLIMYGELLEEGILVISSNNDKPLNITESDFSKDDFEKRFNSLSVDENNLLLAIYNKNVWRVGSIHINNSGSVFHLFIKNNENKVVLFREIPIKEKFDNISDILDAYSIYSNLLDEVKRNELTEEEIRRVYSK